MALSLSHVVIHAHLTTIRYRDHLCGPRILRFINASNLALQQENASPCVFKFVGTLSI
jgi:hypothetical protein